MLLADCANSMNSPRKPRPYGTTGAANQAAIDATAQQFSMQAVAFARVAARKLHAAHSASDMKVSPVAHLRNKMRKALVTKFNTTSPLCTHNAFKPAAKVTLQGC